MKGLERRKGIRLDMLAVCFIIGIACHGKIAGASNSIFDDSDIIDLDEEFWEVNRSSGDVKVSHSTTIIEQEAPGGGDYDPNSDNEDDNDSFSGSGSGDLEISDGNVSLTITNISDIVSDDVNNNAASDIPNTIDRFTGKGTMISFNEHIDSIQFENTNRISTDWTDEPNTETESGEYPCMYSVFDTKHKAFVHENWNYTKLLLKGDAVVWCKNSDRFVLFYTSFQSCRSKIDLFCRARTVTDQKTKKKKRKNRGDYGNGCWSKFAFGGTMPIGFFDKGSFYYICQRFSPESKFGRLFGSDESYFGTILDTKKRIPLVSLSRIKELGDNTWPAVPDMLENSLIKRNKIPWISDWFTAKRKKGMLIPNESTDCQSGGLCRLDEFQPITEDYEHSQYSKAYMVWPSLIGARPDQKIATLTLTNTAPMHPALFSLWQNVLERVRLYAVKRCGIPNPGRYFDNKHYAGHKDLYIISGVVPSTEGTEEPWNQINIPSIFWMTACCVQESKIESFGIYAQNGPNSVITPASVPELERMLTGALRSNTTNVPIKLYPAQAGVCGDVTRDISYSIL